MSINILVIDDDVKVAERLMCGLKRADITGIIGEYIIDDSMLGETSIEQYDVMKYGIKFDVVLIDYQLNCSYTGILVSAWILLQLKIPRLTLTTASYPGDKDYFNGFILKNEMTDNPIEVIKRIAEIVDLFNSQKWLEKQHEQLVTDYHALLNNDSSGGLSAADKNNLDAIEKLLDQFEKILDTEQEKEIKIRLKYEAESSSFISNQNKSSEKIDELSRKLESLLSEIDKYDK